MFRSYLPAVVAAALPAAFALPASAQIVDVGTNGTYPVRAYGISDSGVAVGSFADAGGVSQAFSYTPTGGMVSLGDLGGTATGTAYGVNASGTIVGEAGATGGTEAFRYQSNTMTTLGTLGGANSAAYAVNASGTIVGASDTVIVGDRTAFVWTSGGSMVSLGTLGGTVSEARGISSTGTIVGASTNGSGVNRAFLYNGVTMTDLLGTNASGESGAFGVAGSRVVGSFADGADTKPFLFDFGTGAFTDLTTVTGGTFFDGGFARAMAVNASGVVVGTAQTSLGKRAWAYNVGGSGAVQDLSALLAPSLGNFTTLTDANAITDTGLIAGIGAVGADERGFIVIPEAGSLALLSTGFGLGMAAAMRRRR